MLPWCKLNPEPDFSMAWEISFWLIFMPEPDAKLPQGLENAEKLIETPYIF